MHCIYAYSTKNAYDIIVCHTSTFNPWHFDTMTHDTGALQVVLCPLQPVWYLVQVVIIPLLGVLLDKVTGWLVARPSLHLCALPGTQLTMPTTRRA